MRYTNPQMVKLGKTMAWAWEETMLPMDLIPMAAYYSCPDIHLKFWTPEQGIP